MAVWNKGLTKETDSRVRAQSEEMKGKEFTLEHRGNISYAMRKNNPEVKYCECGCGQPVRRGSRFLPGHNTRLWPAEFFKEIGKKRRGKKCSRRNPEEWKKNLSISKTGKKYPNVSRAKKGNKNPKLSQTMKEQFDNGKIVWNKGYGDYIKGEKNPMYGHTREVGIVCWCGKIHAERRPRSYDRSGPKNPNWKGGFIDYGLNWLEVSDECKRRCNYTCVSCLRRFGNKYLVAHHIIPVRAIAQNREYWYLVSKQENLVPLCHSCHRSIENSRKYDYELVLRLTLTRDNLWKHMGYLN